MKTIDDLISVQPFFSGLTQEQIHALAGTAHYRRLRSGELMFHDGNLANRFFVLMQGEVALEAPADDGHMMRLQKVKAGEILGWSGMFSGTLPKLSARALQPTEVVYFRSENLRDQCEHDPALGYRLFKRVAEGTTERLQATRKELLKHRDTERSETAEPGTGARG